MAPALCPRALGTSCEGKELSPCILALAHRAQGGVLFPCCTANVSALPLTAGRLHRPPLPRHARKAPREIQQQVRAARGPPQKPYIMPRGHTGACSHLTGLLSPLSPWDWRQPRGGGPVFANLRARAGDAPGTGRGQGLGTVWVQGAPSGPVQRGRLLELGRAPNYVHSCFIISTKFQDRQEQARRQGQGRQQVTARSCCARGAGKWHGSSRSCGLQPPSPCSEMPARKKPNGPKCQAPL